MSKYNAILKEWHTKIKYGIYFTIILDVINSNRVIIKNHLLNKILQRLAFRKGQTTEFIQIFFDIRNIPKMSKYEK